MKIVKEEKGLYKFLKTVFDIQKSSKQKYIIGNYGYLYFYTPYRCGKFYQRSEKRIAMEYNFNDYSSYTLSQLPNGDFELRENDALSKEQKSRLITFQVVLMLMFTTQLKEMNTKNLVFKFIQFLNKG